MARVSVIIPAYNHARFIAEAVDSALAQTCPDFEVIVVDDGSTDQTQAVLERYGSRIHTIYQENSGVSAARNAGIAAATGEYLLFLDADDRIPPAKLERQMPPLETQPDVGLVYSGFQYIDVEGSRVLYEIRPGRSAPVLPDLLRRRLYFPPCAAVIRRECVLRVGNFDPACAAAADTDLWVRIAGAGYAFDYVDAPLCQYRVVPGSMSGQVANQARAEFARLDKFFSDPELPAEIRALEAQAYSILYFEFAAKYYAMAEFELGKACLRKALAACPTLASDPEELLEWIAGFALVPPVDAPHRFIDQLFDHLPPEAAALRILRRRAHGRYHVAAAFAAYRAHQVTCARRHILPALLGDPSIVLNRGFLRIAIQALLGQS